MLAGPIHNTHHKDSVLRLLVPGVGCQMMERGQKRRLPPGVQQTTQWGSLFSQYSYVEAGTSFYGGLKRYAARQCGTKSNAVNIILKLFSYHFFTYDELVESQDHPQHTTNPINTATMVVEPAVPPSARIWWIHTAWGFGGLTHVRTKATVEGFC